ncbi:MAG TPA: glycyl-radical enzyme activating protein, partial [Candidatus Atribacteria bacterium]|nr:glycyl-radical enzyme activating protein [Candidatus Atribacteria bacterium]
CPWCHNPECKSPEVDIYYHEDKCQQCGRCIENCPQEAISWRSPEKEAILIDKEKCNKCLKCIEVCPVNALEKVGQTLTFEQIVDEALRDKAFYETSNGGVTLSGGDPLFFPEYSLKLLKKFKADMINTAVETSGYGRWGVLKELANYIDLFLYDVKCMDPIIHKKFIGVDNKLILDNLKKLSATKANIRIRVPVIPGFNDNEEKFKLMANYLQSLENPVIAVDLLPFHNSAEKKYIQLGLDYAYKGKPFMEKKEVEWIKDFLEKNNITTTVGGLIGVGK